MTPSPGTNTTAATTGQQGRCSLVTWMCDAGQAHGEWEGDIVTVYAAKTSDALELEAEWDAEPSVAASSRTRTETCNRVDTAEEVAMEQTRSSPSSALPDNLHAQSNAVAPFSVHMQLDASDAYGPGQAAAGSAMRSASSSMHSAIVTHNSGATRDPALHMLAASRSTDSGLHRPRSAGQ